MAGAMQIASMTARNLGTAAASDVGKRLAGNYGAQNGHLGFRMASAMRQETAQIGQARTAASQSVQARVTQAATQARRTGP